MILGSVLMAFVLTACFAPGVWALGKRPPEGPAAATAEGVSDEEVSGAQVSAAVHHQLRVRLEPSEQRLGVVDTVSLPPSSEVGARTVRLLLHEGLSPELAHPPGAMLAPDARREGEPDYAEAFTVTLPEGGNGFSLAYAGLIHHPLQSVGNEYARGFQSTPGIISEEGVVLAGRSLWLPYVELGGEELVTFEMTVALPEGWDCVSQGNREVVEKGDGSDPFREHVRWSTHKAQDEVYLIAAPFTVYETTVKGVTAMAFLRTPDEALAQKYMDATVQYVKMYEQMLGPYPFTKFALVENFWETGFGMPSFTLLGPRIIRFPFILRTSYPHEVLHNWWGNSVYVDYETGNWAEGLTAYLADHLMREQTGKGHEHRESTLQKYADYVADGHDGPLTSFTGRHSSSSEALGYGKTLMVFHMLRTELGDETFLAGLRDLYETKVWQRAGWADVQASFERASERDLGWFFTQWVEGTGAPELALIDVKAERRQDRWKVTGAVMQNQPGSAYTVTVPIALTLEGVEQALLHNVSLTDRRAAFEMMVEAPPLRLDVDSAFDLFRLLDKNETPPALSGAFGAPHSVILLPSEADQALLAGYRELAHALAGSGEGEVEVKLDAEVETLPSDRGVWVLGWENRFAHPAVDAFLDYPVTFHDDASDVGRATVPRVGHSLVLTARNAKAPEFPVTFLATDSVAPMAGLARKLPHYHKYSYLGFEGDEPANVAKGRWPAIGSPLTVYFAEGAARATLPIRNPLAGLPPVFSKERMMRTVTTLAAPSWNGRGMGSNGLEKAEGYIAGEMEKAGLQPGGDEEWFTPIASVVQLHGESQRVVTRNVIGVLPGTNPAFASQSVVVGAHYDHLGRGWPDVREGNKGKVHPGADDNASGVAVLLELARQMARAKPERTILFVAFTGEETRRLGSRYYVKAPPGGYPTEQVIGMVNLDTVGRLGDGKLLVLGAGTAREWVHIFMGAGFVTGAKVESVSKDYGSSDQASFIEAGVPAVQLFTGPHTDYHAPGDTPDKLDPDGLVAVASVAKEAVEYLSKRPVPLTSLLDGARPPEALAGSGHGGGGRKVSLGTVPDFAWAGEGVKVSDVVGDSPAEKAGLKAGDVVTGIDDQPVKDLKTYSQALKARQPGDEVTVTFTRDGEEYQARATLTAR